MALSKPKLSVGRSSGTTRVDFKVDLSVNWDEVPAGDTWVAYVLIIERDGKTDDFDVRTDGSVYWNVRGAVDDWVVWVPIQLQRPTQGGTKDYSWSWTKSEDSVGKEWGSKEEFKARAWLVPTNVPKRFASSWSGEVKIGL